MADNSKPGLGGAGAKAIAAAAAAPSAESDRRDPDLSAIEPSDGFVALDIGALSLLAGDDPNSAPTQPLVKSFSRKGSQRNGGGGDATLPGELTSSTRFDSNSATVFFGKKIPILDGRDLNAFDDLYISGGPGEKPTIVVHVAGDGGQNGHFTAAPTATPPGGKCRRIARRHSPWLDPRRVLFVFATLWGVSFLFWGVFRLGPIILFDGEIDSFNSLEVIFCEVGLPAASGDPRGGNTEMGSNGFSGGPEDVARRNPKEIAGVLGRCSHGRISECIEYQRIFFCCLLYDLH
ncbi:hypothetical protein ACMD2_05393 [Ananas comosus]|uniref:Uncharacterized protein n=1 Tax=Ananas comosus TaxID=4615 RepID=A0A199V0A9_ANACO|nr:hypothetical protein ACMD2_05393 [Ananas comosus]